MKLSYETWECLYFPYLLDLYSIYYDSESFDYNKMYVFFRKIYESSSKKKTKYLNSMTKTQHLIFTDYILKKKNILNNKHE
jgi:hypothetical protein